MSITSSSARKVRKGATLPATCNPGDIFGKTSGGNEGLYFCVTANTWTGPFSEGDGTGTVTSLSASGGTETTTGSVITTTGTIRGVETVDARTSTTESLLDATRGKLVTFGNAGATAVSIAQAGTAGNFASGWYVDVKVVGAGTVTITPATSTIDGAATLVLTQGKTARIHSDGTNYVTGLQGSLSASGASYLVYTALLTQTGTDAPVATVLENTLGGTVVWARVGAGVYTATLASAFPANKVFMPNLVVAASDVDMIMGLLSRTNDNQLVLSAQAFGSGGVDSVLNTTAVEIRVYP